MRVWRWLFCDEVLSTEARGGEWITKEWGTKVPGFLKVDNPAEFFVADYSAALVLKSFRLVGLFRKHMLVVIGG